MSQTQIDKSRILEELNQPFSLTGDQIAKFRKEGFLKLKEVLSPETLEYYGEEITRKVLELNPNIKPMEERTTYGKAFIQVGNLWTHSPVVKEFVFSARLARLAAELMGVAGVRLYHDQALYKEPGGGITPFHADQYYWPVGTDNTVTVWVPLQETPIEMGPLSFSVGSHEFNFGRDLEISDESERKLQHSLTERNYPLSETAYDLGEVSFHYGWTFHRAGPNRSTLPRRVMTVIYVEDGCRVSEPKNKGQREDAKALFPHLQVGDPLDGPLLPRLYPA